MKASELQYFKGKICTIFTSPINRNFKEENPESYPQPVFMYFVGVVESITDQGMFLQQVANTDSKKPLKTYFFLDKILGIAEEEQLDYNNPQDAEIISKIKQQQEEEEKKMEEKAKQMNAMVANQTSPYVDPDYMSQMASQLKQNFSQPR